MLSINRLIDKAPPYVLGLEATQTLKRMRYVLKISKGLPI